MAKNKTITQQQVSKYIKHLFGKRIKVKVVRYVKYKAGAIADTETQTIFLAQCQLKLKKFPHELLWHEVGHLKTDQEKGFSIKNEVNAQLWAMEEMKRRGYCNLYKDSLEYILDWQYLTRHMSKTSRIIYSKARSKILKELKRGFEIDDSL